MTELLVIDTLWTGDWCKMIKQKRKEKTMFGQLNEKQLEEVFNRFENEVRSNTLSGFDDVDKKEDLSGYSEKALRLHALLQETKTFGCQTNNVKKLVELIIGEDLPAIKNKEEGRTNKVKKYHKRLCFVSFGKIEKLLVVNYKDESVDSVFDSWCIDGNDRITRLATSKEVDDFFSFVRQLVKSKGGFYQFFEWLVDHRCLEDYCDLFFTEREWEELDI